MIIQRAKQQNFPPRPAPGAGIERFPKLFAHGDHFLDGAFSAASEDGVRDFAEQPNLGNQPRRASSAHAVRGFH